MEKLESILLVDDVEITNFINYRLIKKLDISLQTETRKSAKAALLFLHSRLQQRQPGPELILLDINMPGMDGYEFLVEFRKIDFANKNKIIVAMLTGLNPIPNYEKYIEIGINNFLTKPLSKEQLIPIIDKLLIQDKKLYGNVPG